MNCNVPSVYVSMQKSLYSIHSFMLVDREKQTHPTNICLFLLFFLNSLPLLCSSVLGHSYARRLRFIGLFPFGLQGPSKLESIRLALRSRGSDGTDRRNYCTKIGMLSCIRLETWFLLLKWDTTQNGKIVKKFEQNYTLLGFVFLLKVVCFYVSWLSRCLLRDLLMTSVPEVQPEPKSKDFTQ